MSVLFAPNGSLQEASIASDFEEIFLKMALRVEAAIWRGAATDVDGAARHEYPQ